MGGKQPNPVMSLGGEAFFLNHREGQPCSYFFRRAAMPGENTSRCRLAAPARPAGFTLIELLLAILVLGIVLSTVYGAWTGTLRIARDQDDAERVYAMARTVLAQLSADLESLTAYGGVPFFESESPGGWGTPFTNIRFASSRRLGLGSNDRAGGLREVGWFVHEDRDRGEWVLLRQETMYRATEEGPGRDAFDPDRAHIVATGLRSIRYGFTDRQGEDHESWDSRSDGQDRNNRFPSVVTIYLEFENPDDDRRPWHFMTSVFIPLAQGGGA